MIVCLSSLPIIALHRLRLHDHKCQLRCDAGCLILKKYCTLSLAWPGVEVRFGLRPLLFKYWACTIWPDPEILNILRGPGIDTKTGEIDSLESIPGLLKFGLRSVLSLLCASERKVDFFWPVTFFQPFNDTYRRMRLHTRRRQKVKGPTVFHV